MWKFRKKLKKTFCFIPALLGQKKKPMRIVWNFLETVNAQSEGLFQGEYSEKQEALVRPCKTCVICTLRQWHTNLGPEEQTTCQGQSGWGPEQLYLVNDIPAHGRGGGTRWSLRSLLTQTILWFYDFMMLSIIIFQNKQMGKKKNWIQVAQNLCFLLLDILYK